MSSAEPVMGDRVEVSYEGTYENSGTSSIKIRDDSGRAHFYGSDSNVAISVIEPAYIVGEVYQDAKGDKYQRLPGKNLGWRPVKAWQYSRACDVGQDYPTRPLVRLVPENG